MFLVKANIFLITFSFLTSTALALDVWQGEKFVYSTSIENEFVLKINLDNETHGTMVTEKGSSRIIYRQNDGRIEIMPLVEIQFNSNPFVAIADLGEYRQVEMASTLIRVILGGTDETVAVSRIWKSCYQYEFEGQVVDKCRLQNDAFNGSLKLLNQLPTLAIDMKVGDNIVFPLSDLDSVFIKLKPRGQVQVLAHGDSMNSKNITGWSKRGGQIILNFSDDSKITYTLTQPFFDIYRVVGIHTQLEKQKLLVGALAIDQGLDVHSLQTSDVGGSYQTLIASTNEVEARYIFDSGGIGWSEWTFEEETEVLPMAWFWSKGEIQAIRYIGTDGGVFSTITSAENLNDCVSSETNCTILHSQSYKILGQTENRYTMLRLLQSNEELDLINPPIRRLSVWTLEKQSN